VPLDSTVIYLGAAQYGRLATVIAHRTKTRTIDIRLAPAQENAQLGHNLLASVASDVYYSTSDAARRVGLSPPQLSRLTGLLHVLCEKPSRDGSTRTERVNIGLSFKMHSKMLKVRVGGPDAVRDAVGHHLSRWLRLASFVRFLAGARLRPLPQGELGVLGQGAGRAGGVPEGVPQVVQPHQRDGQ